MQNASHIIKVPQCYSPNHILRWFTHISLGSSYAQHAQLFHIRRSASHSALLCQFYVVCFCATRHLRVPPREVRTSRSGPNGPIPPSTASSTVTPVLRVCPSLPPSLPVPPPPTQSLVASSRADPLDIGRSPSNGSSTSPCKLRV